MPHRPFQLAMKVCYLMKILKLYANAAARYFLLIFLPTSVLPYSDRLSQIARIVGIYILCKCHLICQDLQWYDFNYRVVHLLIHVRYLNALVIDRVLIV